MKCVILENLSTTTNIESLLFLDLGKLKIKSLGTGRGVYNL
jgi:hypothetical protein